MEKDASRGPIRGYRLIHYWIGTSAIADKLESLLKWTSHTNKIFSMIRLQDAALFQLLAISLFREWLSYILVDTSTHGHGYLACRTYERLPVWGSTARTRIHNTQ